MLPNDRLIHGINELIRELDFNAIDIHKLKDYGQKILLIDDDDSYDGDLRALEKEFGNLAISCSNVRDVRDILSKQIINVIICDYHLKIPLGKIDKVPVDGLTFLEEVHRIGINAALYIFTQNSVFPTGTEKRRAETIGVKCRYKLVKDSYINLKNECIEDIKIMARTLVNKQFSSLDPTEDGLISFLSSEEFEDYSFLIGMNKEMKLSELREKIKNGTEEGKKYLENWKKFVNRFNPSKR